MSATDTTPEIVVTPEASTEDTVAYNRACPVLEAEALPAPPPEYRRSQPRVRQALRKVDDEHVLLLESSLDACVARGVGLVDDFGKRAPKLEKVSHLSQRLKRIRRFKASLSLLVRYIDEIEDITLNDAILLLEGVKEEYDFEVRRDPNLAKEYEPLVGLFKARSAKIAAGLAQAKKLREAEAAAAKAALEKAAAEKAAAEKAAPQKIDTK
jgi:hypothetical protein